MSGSVNKVILVGNLGKDPEIRRTQDGRPIANFSVAIGNRQAATDSIMYFPLARIVHPREL